MTEKVLAKYLGGYSGGTAPRKGAVWLRRDGESIEMTQQGNLVFKRPVIIRLSDVTDVTAERARLPGAIVYVTLRSGDVLEFLFRGGGPPQVLANLRKSLGLGHPAS